MPPGFYSKGLLRELDKLELAIRCGEFRPTDEQRARMLEARHLADATKLTPRKSDGWGLEFGVPYTVWDNYGLELIGACDMPKQLRDAIREEKRNERRRAERRAKRAAGKATQEAVANFLTVSPSTIERLDKPVRLALQEALTGQPTAESMAATQRLAAQHIKRCRLGRDANDGFSGRGKKQVQSICSTSAAKTVRQNDRRESTAALGTGGTVSRDGAQSADAATAAARNPTQELGRELLALLRTKPASDRQRLNLEADLTAWRAKSFLNLERLTKRHPESSRAVSKLAHVIVGAIRPRPR